MSEDRARTLLLISEVLRCPDDYLLVRQELLADIAAGLPASAD